MEKHFISNFAGARLVDCTPLIPRESSVSKETGRQGAAKRYRCDSRNSKVVRVHMGYILPTVSIDRFTEELSNYRWGKQRSDLGYRGWDRGIISFPVSFSFARGGRGTRGGGTRRTDIGARIRARGSIEGDSGEGERRNRERNAGRCVPRRNFTLRN